jgi:hypothetical protein
MTRTFLIVTALVAGVAATAEAQICAGTAPFTAGQMRVGASAEFPTDAKTFGGEFAWGQPNGLYLGGTVARTSDNNNADLNAMDFGAHGGYEVRFQSMPKLRFCPTASFGYMSGPNVGPVESSTMHYSIGGSVGSVISASDNVAIVPSASLSWVGARQKDTQGSTSATASDSWGQARLAAGIVFNRAITLAPVVTIPLSDVGGDTRFGFAASYNFGSRGGVVQQGGRKGSRRR